MLIPCWESVNHGRSPGLHSCGLGMLKESAGAQERVVEDCNMLQVGLLNSKNNENQCSETMF